MLVQVGFLHIVDGNMNEQKCKKKVISDHLIISIPSHTFNMVIYQQSGASFHTAKTWLS